MISRDCAAASRSGFDLVVIGGGIYGATLLLEAARRGLKALLVERDDFGGATSHNSLRIIHGGLRYVQALDIRRVRESYRAQRWYMHHFPELVSSLPCLLPLYGRGTHRPTLLRAAFALNTLLAGGERDRAGVPDDDRRPPDRVLDPNETATLYPGVDRNGLRGAALWHDCVLPHAPRVLIEILRWACECGAVALNYVEAATLRKDGSRLVGLSCLDRATDRLLEFQAPVVVNCAGPWCGELARQFDCTAKLSTPACLLINVFLDREPPSRVALAVKSKLGAGRTYFLYPWQGGTLAGTYHVPCDPNECAARAEPDQLDDFLADLNSAVPSLNVDASNIRWVFSGVVPAKGPGGTKLASRPMIVDHGRDGGPQGLYSVSGVKYTIAPIVASQMISTIIGDQVSNVIPSPDRRPQAVYPEAETYYQLAQDAPEVASELVRRLAREEAVVSHEDLLLRRTDWGLHPKLRTALTAQVAARLPELPGTLSGTARARAAASAWSPSRLATSR